MSAIVRSVNDSDFDEWYRLSKTFLKTNHHIVLSKEDAKETFDRILDPKVKIWALLAINSKANQPIEFTNYLSLQQPYNPQERILLNGIYVDPDARLKGTGRRLIEAVYKAADELGTPDVFWNTDIDNHAAQLLYCKVGVKTGQLSYRRVLDGP